MKGIKKDLEYLFLNCDFTDQYGDYCDSSQYEDTLERVDEILNIIEGADAENLADCKIAIMRMKQIIKEREDEYFEDYVQEYTAD